MMDTIDRILEGAGGYQPTTFTGWWGFAVLLINIAMAIGLSISMIGIILSGIKWMSSGSDWKKVEAAKKSLVYSIAGFVITAGAWTIKAVIIKTLG